MFNHNLTPENVHQINLSIRDILRGLIAFADDAILGPVTADRNNLSGIRRNKLSFLNELSNTGGAKSLDRFINNRPLGMLPNIPGHSLMFGHIGAGDSALGINLDSNYGRPEGRTFSHQNQIMGITSSQTVFDSLIFTQCSALDQTPLNALLAAGIAPPSPAVVVPPALPLVAVAPPPPPAAPPAAPPSVAAGGDIDFIENRQLIIDGLTAHIESSIQKYFSRNPIDSIIDPKIIALRILIVSVQNSAGQAELINILRIALANPEIKRNRTAIFRLTRRETQSEKLIKGWLARLEQVR